MILYDTPFMISRGIFEGLRTSKKTDYVMEIHSVLVQRLCLGTGGSVPTEENVVEQTQTLVRVLKFYYRFITLSGHESTLLQVYVRKIWDD